MARLGGHWRIALGVAVIVLALVSWFVLVGRGSGRSNREVRFDREIDALLAGIPQQGTVLGAPTAPITVEVFMDLEDPTCRWWFIERLPSILHDDVRTGKVKLDYHAFKTNTYWPTIFVRQQTAALAAGVQHELWDFIYIFYLEQGEELTHYVTEGYLAGIARQTPGLDIEQWSTDRHTGRREELTITEDQQAKALGMHVTPSFRIGKTSASTENLTSSAKVQFYGQHHPVYLVGVRDIARAIQQLGSAGRGRKQPTTAGL